MEKLKRKLNNCVYASLFELSCEVALLKAALIVIYGSVFQNKNIQHDLSAVVLVELNIPEALTIVFSLLSRM